MQYRLTEISISLRRKNRFTCSTCVPHFSFFQSPRISNVPACSDKPGRSSCQGPPQPPPRIISRTAFRGKAGENLVFPIGNWCNSIIARGFFQRFGGCPRCRAAELPRRLETMRRPLGKRYENVSSREQVRPLSSIKRTPRNRSRRLFFCIFRFEVSLRLCVPRGGAHFGDRALTGRRAWRRIPFS